MYFNDTYATKGFKMIENQLQYDLTKKHLRDFEKSLEIIKKRDRRTPPQNANERILFKAERNSLESMIKTFKKDINEYENKNQNTGAKK